MKKISIFFIVLCLTGSLFAADHSGSISTDETWHSYQTHFITGNVTVENGIKLTIESGSTIKFTGAYSIYVNGALIANGTSSSIIFTSDQEEHTAGYWNQLNFSQADAGTILYNCLIYYGGKTDPMIYSVNSGSNIAITNCDIEYSGNEGIYLHDSNSFTISNCHVKNNEGDGIYCNSNNSSPTISSCTISNNGGYGINNNASDYTTISGCTIQNNSNYAIRTNGGAVSNITGSMNISGNTYDAILVKSDNISGTWLDHGVPYVIDGNITVSNSTTLTIEAGNSLKFNGAYQFYVYGTVNAQGNSSNRITFTSNQDSPTQGYWRNIFFQNIDNNCYFDYCDISYGGYYSGEYDRGMIYDESSSSTYTVYFNNCTIEQSKYSAVIIAGNLSPSFINCVIKDNSRYGIRINNNSSQPTFGSNESEWNDIYNNNGGNVGRSFRNNNTTNIVKYVYWGTTVESEIQSLIYDSNSGGSGTVVFDPWLNSSHDQTLPVVLSTFTAQNLNESVAIYWQTQSETDNMGWFLYRNNTNDLTSAENISGMIEGYGTTTQQHSYIYNDAITNPQTGDTYYYWLESIDYSGLINSYEKVAMITIHEQSEPGNDIEFPTTYGLFQNQPNPFVSSTDLSFNLPNTSHTTLSVYNISGQLIRTLYTGSTQGKTIVWDGKDEFGKRQNSGIYLYKLVVDGKTYDIKKLILTN